MDLLLGGAGGAPHSRLGLPAEAPPARIASAAQAALARWQAVAEHPFSARELRTAARAAARTCEGLLAAVPAP